MASADECLLENSSPVVRCLIYAISRTLVDQFEKDAYTNTEVHWDGLHRHTFRLRFSLFQDSIKLQEPGRDCIKKHRASGCY